MIRQRQLGSDLVMKINSMMIVKWPLKDDDWTIAQRWQSIISMTDSSAVVQ